MKFIVSTGLMVLLLSTTANCLFFSQIGRVFGGFLGNSVGQTNAGPLGTTLGGQLGSSIGAEAGAQVGQNFQNSLGTTFNNILRPRSDQPQAAAAPKRRVIDRIVDMIRGRRKRAAMLN